MADKTVPKQLKPFEPGKSGNPSGRPKGARNKTTMAIEALLEGEAEELTRKAIEMAKAGDGPALRMCLDRIAPPRKDAPVCFDLPPIKSVTDVVAASSELLVAVGAGEVSPDEAGRIMALLTSHKVLVETGEFEQRLEALEAKR